MRVVQLTIVMGRSKHLVVYCWASMLLQNTQVGPSNHEAESDKDMLFLRAMRRLEDQRSQITWAA